MLEVAVTVVIIGCILTVVMTNNIERIRQAQFQKTVTEMTTIARASIDYYLSQGVCPTDIGQLSPVFIPQPVTSSSFGSDYQINCTVNTVSVSDLIPSGLAQKNPEGPLLQVSAAGGQDNITITQIMPNAFTGRLLYDKKYLYDGS